MGKKIGYLSCQSNYDTQASDFVFSYLSNYYCNDCFELLKNYYTEPNFGVLGFVHLKFFYVNY